MILYTTTEISIGYYFIISQPTRFLSLKMRKNVPNNGQAIAEDMTSNARHFLPVHLVRFDTFWYVSVRFGTWLYVWYVLVRFGTFRYVGMPRRIFDMKLSPEGNQYKQVIGNKDLCPILMSTCFFFFFLRPRDMGLAGNPI
jgi:hypothetical protein